MIFLKRLRERIPNEGQPMVARPKRRVSPKRQYKLNRRQKNRMKRWQTPDYDPRPRAVERHVVTRLPSRF